MRAQPTVLGDPNRPTDITRWAERIARVLNGNVSFGSSMTNGQTDTNLNVWKATGISPVAPNTDFTIKHSLGRVPLTIVGQDGTNGGVLYRSPVTAWTSTTVTLRCTTASMHYNVILG